MMSTVSQPKSIIYIATNGGQELSMYNHAHAESSIHVHAGNNMKFRLKFKGALFNRIFCITSAKT